MGRIERRWLSGLTRRAALRNLAGFVAGSPLLMGQQDPYRPTGRVPGMNELVTTFDFEAVAYAKIPREAYDYTAHGETSEFTVRRNREAFDWVQLVPKGVVDVSSVETTTELFGTKMAYPIMIAPTAFQLQLHPEAEVAMRQGASGASDTPMIVSNYSSVPFAKISAATSTSPLWFQLYPQRDMETSREYVETAQTAGCRAIAVTVDQQSSTYERSQRNRNLAPGGAGGGGGARPGRAPRRPPNIYRISTDRLWIDWGFIEKIRPFVKVPLLIKGILTAEDARLSVEHGMQGIVVSNHGGRSMDYGPSSLEVLSEVVDAVQGRIPVLIDSGFRRGSDVLKALALGAKAACLGRVPRWGVAAYGAAGAQRVLEIMQAELVMAMASTGRPSLASIDRSLVRTDFPWA